MLAGVSAHDGDQSDTARILRIEKALQVGDERFSKVEEQMDALVKEQKEQSKQMHDINETLGVLNTIASMVGGIYFLGRLIAWIGGITGAVVSLMSMLNYLKLH